MKEKTLYFAHWEAEYEKIMIHNLQSLDKYKIVSLNKLMKHFRNYNQRLKNNNWRNA